LTIPKTHPRLWWTPARLARARQWFARGGFRPRSDKALDAAFCYVVTGDTKYAQPAIDALMRFSIPEERLRQVSVDLYRWNDWVPVVYDWTYNAMTAEQRKTFLDRYEHYVEVISQKSWGGPAMPASNYYWGYLRNELCWAITTYHESPQAKKILDFVLQTRWQKAFVPYARTIAQGGLPPEGSQYGRYMLQYPVLPFTSAGLLGRDLFGETRFFKDAVFAMIYTTTPAPTAVKGSAKHYRQVFSFGDDEMDGGYPSAELNWYGDFMYAATQHWGQQPLGQYARHWINQVRPAASPHVLAVDTSGQERDFSKLPVDYYAPGMGFLFTRNRWGPQASSLLLQLSQAPNLGHLHLDCGTFQMWRNGHWLSKESTGYAMKFNGAVARDTRCHNGLLFGGLGEANAYADGLPQVLRLESGPQHSYAAVDLTRAYRAHRSKHPDRDDNPNVAHVLREFLFIKPLETLVVFDRLEASGEKMAASSVPRTFLLHFPERPQLDGSDRLLAVNGTQALRVLTLLPQGAKREVIDEGDISGKKYAASYYQYRLEETHSGTKQSYSLHVLQGRDTTGADITARPREEKDSYIVHLDHPTLGHAVVVFNRGMTSQGGQFGYSAKETPEKLAPLLDRVQKLTVTDDGPVWE
jgi:hypothetical protein